MEMKNIKPINYKIITITKIESEEAYALAKAIKNILGEESEVVMAYERDHTHILVKDPIKFRKAYIEETYEESGKAYIKKDPQAQVFEL